MIKIIIFMTILLFASMSFADEWNKTDTSLQVAYSLVHLADWNQTIEIAKSDIQWETNLFLGKHPSRGAIDKYFAGTLVGHYLVARWLDKPLRNIWQSTWIGIELGYVNHNIKNGFKLNWNF